MEIRFRKAELSDAEVLTEIYNSSFYDDYIRYGECPAYGKTVEMMRRAIVEYPKFLILSDDRPVGCISCKEPEKGVYEVGCLCVIPEFQGKGIGTAAMGFVKATPHDPCASDAKSRFSSDCLNSTQAGWRPARRIWVI
ncbi:MAG: GNAT family N-acetyltransferase [Ruminococcus sp.]|nr:GNAT family N-acetyltransferase [Ruminococcus sp.]